MSTRFKSRHLARHSNIPWLGRTRAFAHLQAAVSHAAGQSGKRATSTRFPLLAAFLENPLWLVKYARVAFRGRFKPYPTYAADGKDGVYPLRSHTDSGPIRLAIVADWGTGTEEAYKVAEQMSAFEPDYTIHLGDVYYVGDNAEIDENFLGIAATDHTPVKFPQGKVGTLTLPGNHEMYGGGKPYFMKVLPYCSPAPGKAQTASFFALENDHWRIVGLDTGYHSAGIPFLGSLPLLNNIKAIGGDAHLEPAALNWLRANVQPGTRRKATLLLSHHQYFSTFSDEVFPAAARQLAEFFRGQDVVWLWGHEHRLAIYDRFSPDCALPCHARCIGHGGMPVETAKPVAGRAPLLYRDERTDYDIGHGDTAGWNGSVNATIDGPKLTLTYIDLTGKQLYAESFVAGENGSLIRK